MKSLKDMKLSISDNGRNFVDQKGDPFLYVGDTAWTLFKRLNKTEIEEYLSNRAEKGFTVIQAYVLRGLDVKNPYGHVPLIDKDPTQLNEGFFKNVDYIVNRANEMGMAMGLVTVFGEHVRKRIKGVAMYEREEQIFTVENAFIFGQLLGNRYKNNAVFWLLGGDRVPVDDMDIWIAMGKGLKVGCENRHLVSFHGPGGTSSSYWFHHCDWLDFNTIQSGHYWASPNYLYIEHDYRDLVPVKPTLDMEPSYENHPDNSSTTGRILDGHQVRLGAYWAMLAGAAGHGYGSNDIWQFYDESKAATWDEYTHPIIPARCEWRESMDLPGAFGIKYMRKLMELRPWNQMVADQTVLTKPAVGGEGHVQSSRAEDGSFVIVYLPLGEPVSINMESINGKDVKALWYNPRNGQFAEIGFYPNSGIREFTPPTSGPDDDWVLVLEDAEKNLPLN